MKKKTILTLIFTGFLSLSSLQAQEKLSDTDLKNLASQKSEKVSKLLNLSDEQKKLIYKAYYTKEANMNSLNKTEDNSSKITKFESDFISNMQTFLTEDQLKKLKQIQANASGY